MNPSVAIVKVSLVGIFLTICMPSYVAAKPLPKQSKATEATPLRIEWVVKTVNNFFSPQDVVTFFNMAHQAKVSVVYLNIKQDEDDERPSGQVYYRSNIAPIASGYENFDVLASAITQARQHNIKLYVWMPQFHDQVAAKAHPHWQMMAKNQGRSVPFTGKGRVEYFVNPIHPEVQDYQLSLIQEVVSHYDIDGLALDWLRFDDYHMDTSPYTRELAKRELGLDPMDIDFAQPSTERERWNLWRAKKIADYTQRVRNTLHAVKPKVKLAAFVLPPEFTEVGQNLRLISPYLDEVLPMAYFEDWQFSSTWVTGQLMGDVNRLKAPRTSIKPTLDGSGSTEQNIMIIQKLHQQYPQTQSVIWFSPFFWSPKLADRVVHIHKLAANTAKKPGL